MFYIDVPIMQMKRILEKTAKLHLDTSWKTNNSKQGRQIEKLGRMRPEIPSPCYAGVCMAQVKVNRILPTIKVNS